MSKLEILADAAKYDVACTSSGVQRGGRKGQLGATSRAGLCHSFSADGRCITLLKVLLTNYCKHDCAYCVNRRSNDIPRAAFTPRELADLTISFYRRNYIEGLFLSSGVARDADHTMELIIETARILREEEGFRGYIHAKAIPGASPELLERLGMLVDRMSVNIELPSHDSLGFLAPDKAGESVVAPMRLIHGRVEQSVQEAALARRMHVRSQPQRFAPAGQSTQMIIGASPETDHHILHLTEGFYRRFGLKRVFYSAYLPVNQDPRLPAPGALVPLTREHRLYQADWLLRFYGFAARELLDAQHPDLELLVDPKASWALRHMDAFPVEVNTADYEQLLRVPGIGVTGARRIVQSRRSRRLGFPELKRLGISLKRAGYFLTCFGRMAPGFIADPLAARESLEQASRGSGGGRSSLKGLAKGQLGLFDGYGQEAQDTFSRQGHGDVLTRAARAQLLEVRKRAVPGLAEAGSAGVRERAGVSTDAGSRSRQGGRLAGPDGLEAPTESGLPQSDPLVMAA